MGDELNKENEYNEDSLLLILLGKHRQQGIAYQTKPFFFNKSVNSFPFIVLRSDLS